MVAAAAPWSIWLARNEALFSQTWQSHKNIEEWIKARVSAWGKADLGSCKTNALSFDKWISYPLGMPSFRLKWMTWPQACGVFDVFLVVLCRVPRRRINGGFKAKR